MMYSFTEMSKTTNTHSHTKINKNVYRKLLVYISLKFAHRSSNTNVLQALSTE